MRILAVATFCNEGGTLLEWVAHHRRIGVTDFIIYQNDSADTTVRQLTLLDRLGIIHFVQNPRRGDIAPQFRAYRRASRTDLYKEADWAITLDGDEFIQVHGGDGTLPWLIEEAGADADVISINWRLFGSGGARAISLDFLPMQFTRCEPSALIRRAPRYFKSLIKPGSFGQLAIHGPRNPLKDDITWINSSGINVQDLRAGPMRCNDPRERVNAQVNHYAVRDAASYLLKMARGNAGATDNIRRFDYWRAHDLNDEEDRRLADDVAGLTEAVQELDELSDGRLLKLRRRSVAWARRHFQTQLERPEMARVFEQILEMHDAGQQG